MFKKKVKKEYPPGTFIPMQARVCAIIQLCLAFVVILWNASQPFMGELFTYKSQMLIYQDVIGISKSTDSAETIARKERNHHRFETLLTSEKAQLARYYGELQQLSQRTFLEKFERSLHILAFEIPFNEQLWLGLSLILPILLLKRIEGTEQAIWLLPLLTCIYAFDNYKYAPPATLSAEAKLFPSEYVLLNEYLKQPLSSELLKQKEQLLSAWKLYLVQEWSSRFSLNKNSDIEQLAEEGEFAFNIARIKSLPPPKNIIAGKAQAGKENLFILTLYLFWNFFFAATVFRISFKYRGSYST